jgi:histidyl-tRNA synthetase
MFQAVRGMQDILPTSTPCWQQLEYHLQQLANSYAFQEIRLPIIEKTALFHRSIGEITDIVDKEMYIFQDSKGQQLSLRPEGTAGCVRAAIEKHLLHDNAVRRLWYLGPMFRRERPQKGRYRQFHQFGAEAFGMAAPEIDAELILMSWRLWKTLGLEKQLRLELNSLGDIDTRHQYRAQLTEYFSHYITVLDEDSRRRLTKNPLRILDSKNPALQAIIQDAPQLPPCLDKASAQHFERLQALLTAAGLSFTLNPRLVRGLDYYNKTVFEWVIQGATRAQNAICAGGRYDYLVAQLGGPNVPAVGFAIGLERVIQLWQTAQALTTNTPDIYCIIAGETVYSEGITLIEKLRADLPQCSLQLDCIGGRLSNQFTRADKSGAILALIVGEDEIQAKTLTIKPLRIKAEQTKVNYLACIQLLSNAAYLDKLRGN